MHEPPHSATMPSTPLKTAACMTLVPTSMSSVVSFPSWLIYVTRGMVLLVLVAADGGPALRNPQAGVEHFSSGVSPARAGCIEKSSQRGRQAMKDGLRVFDADTHVEPTAEVIDSYVDPGFPPAPCRSGAIPPAGPGRRTRRRARPARLSLRPDPVSSASSARRRRARPIAAATPIGWARSSRVPAPRTTRPTTASGHGRRGNRHAFPDPDLVDELCRPRGPGDRGQHHPRLPPPHGRISAASTPTGCRA